MPKLTCPVKGYEKFTVQFPDSWEVRHYEQFVQGMAGARSEKLFNDESPVNTARFYGCQAVCSVFENAPDKPLEKWPLAVFLWFMDAVYYNTETGLDSALTPPKN